MWWAAAAWASEPVVGGTVRPVVWADVVPGDFADEDKVEVDTWARLFANGDLPSGDRWFVEGRLQHHALFGPAPTVGEGTPTEAWWELQLGESGWDGKVAGPVRLRAGTLVETWGAMTLLPVSDQLNARDLRNGLRQDPLFNKLAAPMAVVSVEDRGVRFETTLVPFPVSDRMWLRDTDWSYARQGFTTDLLNEASRFEDPGVGTDAGVIREILGTAAGSIDGLSPQNRRNLDQSFTTSSIPEALLYTGDVAERMELTGPRATLGLTGGWIRSRQPLSSLSPALADSFRTGVLPGSIESLTDSGVLVVEWPRSAVAGLDATALAGPVQLRLDSMFKTTQVVRRSFGAATTSPWLGTGVGLDYVHGATWALTFEARWQHLFAPPPDPMFALEDQVQVAGGVRVTTARDRLVLQLGGSFDPTFVEGLVRPSVTWKATDHVHLEVLANVLAGSTPAPLGFLEDGTSSAPVPTAFEYTGGPLSYFQQNDEVALAVTFQR